MKNFITIVTLAMMSACATPVKITEANQAIGCNQTSCHPLNCVLVNGVPQCSEDPSADLSCLFAACDGSTDSTCKPADTLEVNSCSSRCDLACAANATCQAQCFVNCVNNITHHCVGDDP